MVQGGESEAQGARPGINAVACAPVCSLFIVMMRVAEE